jgi:hypothetical protein
MLRIVKEDRHRHQGMMEGCFRRLTMDEATKIDLIKDEYLLLQNFYEDFDKRLLTIKGWSGTIALGLVGTAFSTTEYLWLLAAGISLIFWFLDALWKSYQYLHAYRISVIEQAMREGRFENIEPMQIYTSWFDAYPKLGMHYWKNFWLVTVYLPHLVTLILGITLFIMRRAGVF